MGKRIRLLTRKFLKLHGNVLEGFGVGLKTFLGLAVPKGLAVPNQHCQREIEAGFRVIILAGKPSSV